MRFVRVDQYLKRLVSIENYEMRATVFSEMSTSLDTDELTYFFVELESGLRAQRDAERSIVHSLFNYWLTHSCDWTERLGELPNRPLVVQLRHQAGYSPEDAWKQFDAKDYTFPDDRMLTLGERRARARLPGPKTVEHFMYDPDRIVIQNLLQNARMTEPHVLRMASRRPTTSAALIAVSQSRRYGLSRSVMLALVQNPFLPYRVAFGIAFLLSKTELKMLKSIESLSPLLKAYVRRHYRQLYGST